MPKNQELRQRGPVPIVLAAAAALILLALVFGWRSAPETSRADWPDQFESVGEQLYFTGRGKSGAQMIPRGGNQHMTMMGSGGCVDCHGTDRKGGRLWPSFLQVAPSITAIALTGEHGDDGHGHEGYDAQTLARAITEGLKPDDSELSEGMPRWSMSNEDLTSLLTFLLNN